MSDNIAYACGALGRRNDTALYIAAKWPHVSMIRRKRFKCSFKEFFTNGIIRPSTQSIWATMEQVFGICGVRDAFEGKKATSLSKNWSRKLTARKQKSKRIEEGGSFLKREKLALIRKIAEMWKEIVDKGEPTGSIVQPDRQNSRIEKAKEGFYAFISLSAKRAFES